MSNYETLDEYGLDKYNDHSIIHNNKFKSKKLPTNPRFYSYTEELQESNMSENLLSESNMSESNMSENLLYKSNMSESKLSENLLSESNMSENLLSESSKKSTIIESVSPIPTLPLNN